MLQTGFSNISRNNKLTEQPKPILLRLPRELRALLSIDAAPTKTRERRSVQAVIGEILLKHYKLKISLTPQGRPRKDVRND